MWGGTRPRKKKGKRKGGKVLSFKGQREINRNERGM